MTIEKYLPRIKEVIKSFDKTSQNKYFLFGSSVRKEDFNDIDIGVIVGEYSDLIPRDLKEKMEQTTIPYFFDVVDFSSVRKSFKDYVLNNEPIIWIN